MTAAQQEGAIPLVETTQTAWWVHWLNVAIAVVAFVGVSIHPGWHPPPLLAEIVGPVAVVGALLSGLVFAVLDHRAGISDSQAAWAWITEHADQLGTAVEDVADTVSADTHASTPAESPELVEGGPPARST